MGNPPELTVPNWNSGSRSRFDFLFVDHALIEEGITSSVVRQKLDELCNNLREGICLSQCTYSAGWTVQVYYLQVADAAGRRVLGFRTGRFALFQSPNQGESFRSFGHKVLMICESKCRIRIKVMLAARWKTDSS